MGIFTSIGLLFFPIMGVIALIIGIRGIIKYNQFPKVEAEITGHDKDLGEKRMMYADIYSYTFNGQLITDAHSYFYNSKKSEIGSKKEIAVDPKHPEVPVVKGGYNLALLVGIVFILGSLFTIPL